MPKSPPPPPPRTTLTSAVNELFADLSTAPPRQPRRGATGLRVAGPKAPPSQVLSLNPCLGCPRARAVKVLPIIPPKPKVIVLGLAPGGVEEKLEKPFQGPSGEMIREGLAREGFDVETDVGFANLARCRPGQDDFESKEWQDAERRCMNYLGRDLAKFPGVPLLLLGTRPLQAMTASDMSVTAMRGLWVRTDGGRQAYVARHPSGILRVQEPGVKNAMAREWQRDLHRMAERITGREKPREIDISVFRSPREGEALLRRLARHQHPWIFDIESYDAKETPSRKWVSTDPCHEDFMVRGVAIAWGPTKGAWFELMGSDRCEARELLDPVFSSSAPKGGFNGGFDEEGLVYNDWVTVVNNRRIDPMLELVALSDGRHASLRLERYVVDLLGYPQYWNGVDKGLIRVMKLEDVARAAVEDACATWALSSVLHKRLEKGQYLEWKTWYRR